METFKKRQKEMKRLERQRDKAARREQRKLDRANGIVSTDDDAVANDAASDDAPETASGEQQPAGHPTDA